MNDLLDATEPIPETAEETAERLGFYAEIKRALIARGIPEEEIAFIHDFPTAASKLHAFAEVNAGRIRVLIASIDRAGCGANFQERLIASHNLSIPWKPSELEQRDGFMIELRKATSSEETVTFTDRARAGAHLRQLCFAVDRESRSRGAITRVIGRYRGFEIVVRAYGRQLDSPNALFSGADLFLRAGENELSYGVNLGESDAGVIQSMDAQLRGLEGKLEKSLAEQSELEHRRRQIDVELARGFGHAARYKELRRRLDALNQELTRAGVEIGDPPELSNLDEDAFRPVESGVSVHQIFSLTEQTAEIGEENAVPLSDQTPIVSESPAVESECVITVAADLRLAQKEDEADQACIRAEASGGSKNSLFMRLEEGHSETAIATKREAASKSATAKGPSQQMAFDWS